MAGILSRTGSGSGPPRTIKPSQELLDDLCSRFVLNAPEEELQSFERILFLIEQAHWFYEDNTRVKNPSLKQMNTRDFILLMFQSCAALRPYISDIDDIYKDFTSYKVRVPVSGAIILNESSEKCLLVKGWKGTSWSFPRGKKNKDEEDEKCAIREVLEETGFDISELINVADDLEMVIGEQRIRLFIVGGVSENTMFAPQTRNEISDIAWHRIDELPVGGNEFSHSRGATGLKYYMVTPFVGPLKSWIAGHEPSLGQRIDMSTKAMMSSSSISANTAPLLPLPVTESPAKRQVEEVGRSFLTFRFDYAAILQRLDEK